jgi:hypothetical protein
VVEDSEFSVQQWIDREELFERERENKPNFDVWKNCVLACEGVEQMCSEAQRHRNTHVGFGRVDD